MDYNEATSYLFSKHAKGMKLGLENVIHFLNRIGHPELGFPSIHIAGTNGKGSTAAILESILREAGNKTGLYTSPHLIDMRERIQISGQWISPEKVIHYIQYFKPEIEATNISFFEILTSMAFLYFLENETDIAILETGLGGRLDATNVVQPLFSMITEIGLDHTRILGKTLKSITYEKGSIFKSDIPCLMGVNSKKVKTYFQELARDRTPLSFCQENVHIRNIRLTDQGSWFDAEAELFFYRNLFLRLLGQHQVNNCRLVLLAVNEFMKRGWAISEKSVREGLKKVRWPARLELLSEQPKLLLDSAHNPLGIRSLVKALKTLFDYDKLILLFGVLKDKDYRKMIEPLVPLAQSIIFTRPQSDRALEPEHFYSLPILRKKSVQVIPVIKKAWEKAVNLASKNDLVCGTGSMFLTGELLRIWKTTKKETVLVNKKARQ